MEVFQYPDGRIEIRVAGESLPYSTYDKLGAIDQGAIVENKRLSSVLRVVQAVQAHRDNRKDAPSTAHRADGSVVAPEQVVGSKRQKDLDPKDLKQAIEAVHPELLPPPGGGRQTARRGRPCKWDYEKSPKADIST